MMNTRNLLAILPDELQQFLREIANEGGILRVYAVELALLTARDQAEALGFVTVHLFGRADECTEEYRLTPKGYRQLGLPVPAAKKGFLNWLATKLFIYKDDVPPPKNYWS